MVREVNLIDFFYINFPRVIRHYYYSTCGQKYNKTGTIGWCTLLEEDGRYSFSAAIGLLCVFLNLETQDTCATRSGAILFSFNQAGHTALSHMNSITEPTTQLCCAKYVLVQLFLDYISKIYFLYMNQRNSTHSGDGNTSLGQVNGLGSLQGVEAQFILSYSSLPFASSKIFIFSPFIWK